ncbi:MAG TPA: L,D-transpeptidase family protein, partial [Chitinophagaceae bacterium]
EYSAVKKMIRSYQAMEQMPAFADVVVTSSAVNTGNSALIKRLYQLSIIDSVPAQISVTTLRNKIRDVQRLFNLVEDGLLRTAVLKELNVPLRVRISELKITLNTIRWLNCIKSAGSVIVVNIPSASLLVYENGEVILESRVIVGKKTTRTPTLTSKVTEVVLYPYWMVPKSIATKELLPLIKKNPGYLNLNNMQVLDARGKVMNPADIDWNALSTNYFPYVLRQSTGCDNSLGLVKLNFYNPYNVYLHDTPWKVLFAANKRYFSHGCMRVEKAIELAHLLLEGNTMAVDSLEEKGCLINQSPVAVPASLQMPVFVLYNTAWIDSSANVSFDEDIYNRFQHLRKKPGALTNVAQIDDRSH